MFTRFRNILFSLIWRVTKPSDYTEAISLRTFLRRNPTWLHGHRLFAIVCLNSGDFKCAYAASLCVLQLAQNPSDRADGYALLGRCYTACGDADSALSYFEKSAATAPTVFDLNEHIAAAYILAKDFEAAVTHLEALEKTKLSAEGKAALQYARSKIS